MTQTSIITRPHPTQIGVKEVYRDGQRIAEYWFCRTRRDVGGRITVTCSGHLKFTDGREIDLSDYAYDADVRRDLKSGALS